jgi:AcrR family transcriptional regulator
MRPATGGRPRSSEAHHAILEATRRLLGEHGYPALTIEKVAARAGVGKRTIYRWWASKGSLIAEAFGERPGPRRPDADTDSGRVAEDVRRHLGRAFADGRCVAARSMMAEAQLDERFAEEFRACVAARRETLRDLLRRGVDRGEIAADVDLDVLVDALHGVFWYRLLVGHLPVDQRVAGTLVAYLLDGVGADRAR